MYAELAKGFRRPSGGPQVGAAPCEGSRAAEPPLNFYTVSSLIPELESAGKSKKSLKLV